MCKDYPYIRVNVRFATEATEAIGMEIQKTRSGDFEVTDASDDEDDEEEADDEMNDDEEEDDEEEADDDMNDDEEEDDRTDE